MRHRYRVYPHNKGDVYWYVIDSTLPKRKGQVVALCHSRKDVYKVTVALNALESTNLQQTTATVCQKRS